MQDNCGNIYKRARATAGLTQERFAEMIGLGELPDPEARFPGISARAGFSLWKSLSREKRKSLLELQNFDFAQSRIFRYWRRVGRSEELKLLALLER